MSYTDRIWERASLQQIREFVLHGVEEKNIDPKTYRERLGDSSALVYNRIKSKYPDEKECEDVMDEYSASLTNYADVYTEIGMKIGARLLIQLLQMDDSSLME